MTSAGTRLLFVTGKLAEPAMRRVLAELESSTSIQTDVAVLNITVAALMTTKWIARHLTIPPHIDGIVIPGLCPGDVDEIAKITGVPVTRGPNDLRDLPEFFGKTSGSLSDYGGYDIEILAEINHAPRKSVHEILAEARRYRDSGADVIDLGCDPGGPWLGVSDVVRALCHEGMRVSIDSFDSEEVAAAIAAGAELVLSVNGSNVERVRSWQDTRPDVEVVAIPDTPSDLDSLTRTVERLAACGVRYRLDPILEPIGFGFAMSLGRYLEVRRRFPDAEVLMGIGNLTELTEVDSAGVNVLLAGFCQELGIRSVLTTEVINWARSSVREFDVARRMVHYAVRHHVIPKRLDSRLVMLRDPKVRELGDVGLLELARQITDRNYRIFAERGEIHIMNGSGYWHGRDPFTVFAEVAAADPRLDPSHAFYLGYEFAKAITALTLGKSYTQDQSLHWGILTMPELSHRGPNRVD